MQNRFAPEVEELLRAAGWYPGRKVSEEEIATWDAMRPLFPAARQVLEEFNGLYVNPKIDLALGNFRFCIDAVAAWDESGTEETVDYERAFGCKVRFIGIFDYKIGYSKNRRYVQGLDHMLVDERGRIFFMRFNYILIGDTIEQALHSLILGGGRQGWDVENDTPIIAAPR